MPDFLPRRHRTSRSDRHHNPYDSDSDSSYDDRRRRARSSSYDSVVRDPKHDDHRPRHSHHHGRRSRSLDRRQPSNQHHRRRRDSPYPFHEDDRTRHREQHHRSHSDQKLEHAANAAIDAAAVEAFLLRREPGAWTGRKGARVATAALGAAALDMAIDKDPNKHSKRTLLESTIGGLLANRLANGPRDDLRRRLH
ncbi:hypothetical protein PT974_11043 [Cladobotryum mycophilum]|uniref:Uncharacterized protein n=1 Tax=Cladobotryum mycophilum TaxID=491253 RepID=A0ABR0SBG7_9HYPO